MSRFWKEEPYCKSQNLIANYRTLLQVTKPYCKLQNLYANYRTLLQIAKPYCKLQNLIANYRTLLIIIEPYCKLQNLFANYRTLLQITKPYCKLRNLIANYRTLLQIKEPYCKLIDYWWTSLKTTYNDKTMTIPRLVSFLFSLAYGLFDDLTKSSNSLQPFIKSWIYETGIIILYSRHWGLSFL